MNKPLIRLGTPAAPVLRAFRCKKCRHVFKAERKGKISCPQCTSTPTPERAAGAESRFAAILSSLRPKLASLPKGMKLLVPAAVAVLGFVMLGFLAARPDVEPPKEVTQIRIEEGECRMLTIPFDPAAPPAEFRTGDAAVLDQSIFHVQKDPEGLLHVLVTGVSEGETSWSVVFRNGRRRIFETRVLKPLSPTGDRELALRKIEEARREPSNLHRAMTLLREACDIFAAEPYGSVDTAYNDTRDEYEAAREKWSAEYLRVQGELELARMKDDGPAIRRALRELLTLAPVEASAEYQRNLTLLKYVHAEKKS